MARLSDMYCRGDGCEVDLVQSFEWLRKSAERGCEEAFQALALKYMNGSGCEIDLKEAERWEEKFKAISDVNSDLAQF
jgi:TPR repeat protein